MAYAGESLRSGETDAHITVLIRKLSDTSTDEEIAEKAKSIQSGARKRLKSRKLTKMNVQNDNASSSSDSESASSPKLSKPKRKKVYELKKRLSSSDSESVKENDDTDTSYDGMGNSSAMTSSNRGSGRVRCLRSRGGGSATTFTFLQNGPCFEVAPHLIQCRECHWAKRCGKVMTSIICRFYAFRKLKYDKNRRLVIAGFSDPSKDAYEEDKKIWLSAAASTIELDVEMSCFILREVGDRFCELLRQEKEVESHHLKEDDNMIVWKKMVQGVRETCDVCETTLFNFHWTCGNCGFAVCLDCYKSRTSSELADANAEPNTLNANTNSDSFNWLTCTGGDFHIPRRLLLTQIAAVGVLAEVAQRVHSVRAAWMLGACSCGDMSNADLAIRIRTRKIRRQLSHKKVNKEDVLDETISVAGSSGLQSNNGVSDILIAKWLADVSRKTETTDNQSNSSSSDSEGGSFSTFRNMLIRSAPEVGETSAKNTQKKACNDILSDVIYSVVDEKKDDDSEFSTLSNLANQRDRSRCNSDDLHIRIMTLTESKLLYPDVPHAWLCDGKLLHLTDPRHQGNYKLFQDQWKRGQPVLVSDVSSLLDKDLWSPESFSRDFGDTQVDLVNCASGLVVPNQLAKKFWDGFQRAAQRLRDERGAPMVLKLKDWPPSADFAEILPTRFNDLMSALPLAEYTSRKGKLNLAARLPDCFVSPDLGPKMYTAYGGSGGTTNLHLDVSDAVNVMVYASAPSDAQERAIQAARAVEEAGVDVLSRQRATVNPPAALWHIYAAKDANKIRDFLVRAELERGARLRPRHDPVHDQTWYLDATLRERLYQEYGVEGYSILQCPGDAVFIPAGAPHQVRNLLDCIKIAEDFVSPENVSHCLELAQEFRQLSHRHSNKEDKLQIKNIVYHAVKDSVCCLEKALEDSSE